MAEFTQVVALVGSIVLLAFATWVGWLGKFRGINLAFFLFGAGFALGAGIGNLGGVLGVYPADPAPGEPTWPHALADRVIFTWPAPVFYAVACAGLVLLMLRFAPQQGAAAGTASKLLIWPLAVGAFVALDAVLDAQADFLARPIDVQVQQVAFFATFFTLVPLMWVAAGYQALRFRGAALADVPRIALMAAALALYPAASLGYNLYGFVQDPSPRDAVFTVGLLASTLLACALLWLRNTAMPDRGRIALRVFLVVLGAATLTIAATVWLEDRALTGFARLAAVAILGYAVLKHQILGIDVKLRWTLSRSTVAAVFVAVFVAVQTFVSEYYSSERGVLWGGLAAGALVFALAPLQRFADRFAARAVPGGGRSESEQLYRGTLRRYLRDGMIDADEELHLARLADKLGLSGTDAVRIRQEES